MAEISPITVPVQTDAAASVEAVAKLARSAAAAKPERIGDRNGDERLLVQTLQTGRGTEEIKVIDLDTYGDAKPPTLRVQGTYRLADVDSLIAYAEPFQTEHTTAWVDLNTSTISVVLDDHRPVSTAEEGLEQDAGLREHHAKLTLKASPEWEKWARVDGEFLEQVAFGEFLEENSLDILDPDGATLLELVRDFRSTTTGEFVSVHNATNGDRELIFKEVSTDEGGSGRLRLPDSISISLRRYVGEDRQTLNARLRWRPRNGTVKFAIQIEDIDGVTERALDNVRARLSQTFPRTFLGTGQ